MRSSMDTRSATRRSCTPGLDEFVDGRASFIRDGARRAATRSSSSVGAEKIELLQTELGADATASTSPTWPTSARTRPGSSRPGTTSSRERAATDGTSAGSASRSTPSAARGARRVPASRVAAEPRVRRSVGVVAAVPVRRRAARSEVIDEALRIASVVITNGNAAAATHIASSTSSRGRSTAAPGAAASTLDGVGFATDKLDHVRSWSTSLTPGGRLVVVTYRRPGARGERGRDQQPPPRRRRWTAPRLARRTDRSSARSATPDRSTSPSSDGSVRSPARKAASACGWCTSCATSSSCERSLTERSSGCT